MGVKELNQPTPAQLDDTPDKDGMVDCYKKLDPDEPKAIDWRRKIGGMLMHLLGGKAHAGKFSKCTCLIENLTCPRQKLHSGETS